MKQVPDAIFSVSFTTRASRGQEKDGVDYRFVDVMTFKERSRTTASSSGPRCTVTSTEAPQSVIDEALAKRGLAVFDIDVQGGQAIKQKYPEAALVFIVPPSMQELDGACAVGRPTPKKTIRSACSRPAVRSSAGSRPTTTSS